MEASLKKLLLPFAVVVTICYRQGSCYDTIRLWNALVLRFSGDSRKPVGDALAKIVASQWVKVGENQRFALISPPLYAPLLKEKCEDIGRSGFSQVASILKTAIVAVGARCAKDVTEFLTQVELGERATLLSAEEGPK